jgi:hypothetical protein
MFKDIFLKFLGYYEQKESMAFIRKTNYLMRVSSSKLESSRPKSHVTLHRQSCLQVYVFPPIIYELGKMLFVVLLYNLSTTRFP